MELGHLRIVWEHAVARLDGPIDRYAMPDFVGLAVVAAARPITIDLAGVTSVDAVGLSLLGGLVGTHPTVTLINVPAGERVLPAVHP